MVDDDAVPELPSEIDAALRVITRKQRAAGLRLRRLLDEKFKEHKLELDTQRNEAATRSALFGSELRGVMLRAANAVQAVTGRFPHPVEEPQ